MNNQLDSFCLITNRAFLRRLFHVLNGICSGSRTSLQNQLSFIPMARPSIRCYFNVFTAATAPKASPNCHKNLSTMTDESCIQNPISIVKDHETWTKPCIDGLCFSSVSVLLIYFYCVTYFQQKMSIFLSNKNVAHPSKTGVLLHPSFL